MGNNHKHLNRILDETRNSLPDTQSEWPHEVQRALNCIKDHLFNRKLTVGWMKEQCQLNGSNFSGRFKYFVGKKPRQYWLHHRIIAAKILLQEELLADVSLMEIALSLGFNSHSAFSKAFKRIEGVTPSGYKREKNSMFKSRCISRAYSR